MTAFNIRVAKIEDIPFILEGIVDAEFSGSRVFPYQALFGLDVEATKNLIRQVFEEELDGQEWHLPQFRILEVGNTSACCLSYWTEGANGTGSGLLKAQALAWILGNRWSEASDKLNVLKTMQLPRLSGAMQLECIYTKPDFRGQGLVGKLIDHCIAEAKLNTPNLEQAEIQLLGSNEAAMRSYTKCGFLNRAQASSSDAEILNLLADNTRISLVKQL